MLIQTYFYGIEIGAAIESIETRSAGTSQVEKSRKEGGKEGRKSRREKGCGEEKSGQEEEG